MAGQKRCSLNALLPPSDEPIPSHQPQHFLFCSDPNGPNPAERHRLSLGKPSICSLGAGRRSPLWRRQLRSKVFIRALLIVAAHCAFWLPYNCENTFINSFRIKHPILVLNLLRFIDEPMYESLVEKGALLVEDLIVMNAMINPVLYGYGK